MTVRLSREQRAEIAAYAVYFASDAIESAGLSEPSDAFMRDPADLVDLYDRLGPQVELLRELQAGSEVSEVDALRDVAERMKAWMLQSAMDDCDAIANSADPGFESTVREDLQSMLARVDLATEVLEVVN
jgi:hypothetical protein